MIKFRELYSGKIKVIDIVIILITFLCFIGMMMCSLISFYNSKENQIKLKESYLQQYTNECKNSIDEYFEYNFDILKYLKSYPEVYNMNWNEQYNFLKNQEEYLKFSYFIIMDLEGNGYYTNGYGIQDQSEEQFFSDVINNEMFLTEPFMEEKEHRAITTLSEFIYRDGKKVGALCGVIDLSKIYENFENKEIGNNGYSFIIDGNGNYIAHKDSNYVFNKNNFFEDLDNKQSYIDSLKKELKTKNTYLKEIILNGKEYYATFSRLKGKNWNLVFVVPKSEFLIRLNNFAIYQFMTIIFGILLIILSMKLGFQFMKNRKLTYIDSLTNINNRVSIDVMLKKLEHNYKSKITIVSFDLNDFKYVNDTYGHHIGDQLLYIFSNMLNNTFGNIGFVGRMGGDEFISILVNRDISEVECKLKEIDELISKYNNKSICKIKTSYGYAVREVGERDSLTSIYEEADKKMYKFKSEYKKINNF